MRARIQIVQMADFTSKLRLKGLLVQGQAERAITMAAAQLLAEANKHVAIDSGALMESGKITTDNEGKKKVAIVSYGDNSRNPDGYATKDYALTVHEVYNPKNPETYKWLEKTLAANQTTLLNTLASVIRNEL